MPGGRKNWTGSKGTRVGDNKIRFVLVTDHLLDFSKEVVIYILVLPVTDVINNLPLTSSTTASSVELPVKFCP